MSWSAFAGASARPTTTCGGSGTRSPPRHGRVGRCSVRAAALESDRRAAATLRQMDLAARPPGGRAAVRDARRVALLCIACAGAAATAAAIAFAGATSRPGLVAVGRALIVGVPIAVGLYARYRRPDERFGLVLVAAGAVAFMTTLAESHDEVAYTAGRLAGWLMEGLLVYLILSFPTGWLTDRRDRTIARAMAASWPCSICRSCWSPRISAFRARTPAASRTARQRAVRVRAPAGVRRCDHAPLGAVLVLAVMVAVVARSIAGCASARR